MRDGDCLPPPCPADVADLALLEAAARLGELLPAAVGRGDLLRVQGQWLRRCADDLWEVWERGEPALFAPVWSGLTLARTVAVLVWVQQAAGHPAGLIARKLEREVTRLREILGMVA